MLVFIHLGSVAPWRFASNQPERRGGHARAQQAAPAHVLRQDNYLPRSLCEACEHRYGASRGVAGAAAAITNNAIADQ